MADTGRDAWPLAFLLVLAGCVPPAGVSLSPEAAMPACEVEALAELKRMDATVESADLDPLADIRVEERTPPMGEQGVTLVITGQGIATGGPSAGPFRYTCLGGSNGRVLFVQVVPERSSPVLGECAGRPEGVQACLRSLVLTTDSALAKAEAEAVTAARRRSNGSRPEIDEPAAASIGAWRVYRDAECVRRHAETEADRRSACLVELTRARINELRS